MRFIFAFFAFFAFFASSLLGACASVTDSSVTVDPSSAFDGSGKAYSGRVTSDPPGIDCVLAADGSHAGSCEMTTPTSRPVVLTAVPDPGSGVTEWVNASDGAATEGPMFVSGAALTLTMKAGTHPVWAVYFGPPR